LADERNAYRQGNVFFYPPQDSSMCNVTNPVVGDGECGTNGNTKLFQAGEPIVSVAVVFVALEIFAEKLYF